MNTNAGLKGLRIINTRPAGREAALDEALRAEGAWVEHLPLLETLPLEPEAAQHGWLMNLDRYQAVFVVSPLAAERGVALLGEYWPQWPLGPIWIAVGAATAHVLKNAGLQPLSPSLETSEGVLAIPALSTLAAGDRVLVLRGNGGRNLVRDWLEAHAVRVDYLNLYSRHLPARAVEDWQTIRCRQPDAIVLTSGESLRYWLQVAGTEALTLPAVVISARLAELARAAGLTTVMDSGGMAPQAITGILRAWRQAAGRGID